jgi:hypothetical protein
MHNSHVRSLKPQEDRFGNDRSERTADAAHQPRKVTHAPERSVNELMMPTGIDGRPRIRRLSEQTRPADIVATFIWEQ